MKLKSLFTMAFVASLFQSCMGILKPVPNVPDCDLKEYTYRSTGMTSFPTEDISVSLLSDGRVQLTRLDKENWGERESYYVGTEVLQQVKEIIREENMMGYKDHYRTKLDVLDGTSWGLTATFVDGTQIRSGGYMAWPKDDGIDRIKTYLYSVKSDSIAPVPVEED